MKLSIDGVQFGTVKSLTDVVEQIVCTKVAYVERTKDGFNIVTYGSSVASGDFVDARRIEIERRFYLNRRRTQRYKVWIDGKYDRTYPTIYDFLFSLLNVHVLYIDVNGTQIWMDTIEKYGSPKKTMALCSNALEHHKNRIEKKFGAKKTKKAS